MKNISNYSVKKPITVLMGILIVIMLGIVSLSKLPLSLLPDINLPFSVVVTTYQGANPYEVEEEVSKKIESQLMTVSNFKSMSSTSSEHFSLIIVEFEQSTNMDTAFLEMRESLDMIEFVDGVGNPSIIKFDPSMMPVMVTSISREFGDVSDEEALILTSEWINRDLLSELESIEGVAGISLSGASNTSLQLTLNNEALTNYNLSQEEVLRIIESQNIEGLIGIVPDTDGIKMLYLGDNIEGLNSLKTVPVTYDEINDKIIRIDDISTEIKFVNQNTNSYNRVNGKEAVSLVFQKQSDSDITTTVRNIQDKLDQIVNNDEYEASYVELLNQGEYIEKSVGSVLNNLLIGGAIAVLILFLFLRDIRPTLIVALSIPTSIIAAFTLMYFTGVTLNVISMGGLALGIGMLVDNSIVVIENIYRLLNKGLSKKEAAIEGAKQVGTAITASTLTTISVFLPVLFIENMIAEIFISMALTVTYSLLASLVIAITLVPSISSKILKERKIKEINSETPIYKYYTKFVKFGLRNKLKLVFLTLLLFIVSTYFSIQQGIEMLPQTDEGQININLQMIKGTKFEQTTELTNYLVDEIMEIEDIDIVSASLGSGFSMFGESAATDSATITILLNDNRSKSTFKIADDIQDIYDETDFSQFTYVTEEDVYSFSSNSQNSEMGGGFFGSGLEVKIKGDDLYKMEEISNEIVEIMKSIEGAKDYSNGIDQSSNVVRIVVNKDEAIKLGLTENDFLSAIQMFYKSLGFEMMSNESTALMVPVDGVKYEITLPAQDFNMDVSALDFLSMVRVFPYDIATIIEQNLNNDDTFVLYLPNIPMLATENNIPNLGYNENIPMGALVINPYLRYDEINDIIYQVSQEEFFTDTNIALASVPVTSLYSGNLDQSPTFVDNKATGFSSIIRDGKTRIITTSANLETGFKLSKVNDQLKAEVEKYTNSDDFMQKYEGISVEVSNELMTTQIEMMIAVLVAIALVYMIMAIQFQSLKYPLIVLFTIPLAFTGGLFALIITGLPISMVAMVGLIVLTGIIVNNGIVLIDYINQLIESGVKIEDAIIEAGRTRLRPILMTALTTSLALITMAIGIGEGSELLQPLAITAIGGLMYATILTLVIVPIMYKIFSKKQIRKELLNEKETINNQ